MLMDYVLALRKVPRKSGKSGKYEEWHNKMSCSEGLTSVQEIIN